MILIEALAQSYLEAESWRIGFGEGVDPWELALECPQATGNTVMVVKPWCIEFMHTADFVDADYELAVNAQGKEAWAKIGGQLPNGWTLKRLVPAPGQMSLGVSA